ncbi:MAG: helix-turn-helix transcriptional regulator [Candidatus Diapherotrites archaeon]|nr:helix-turn-helix transcriptional regulator [Candidatus Diapherotrites archaeon]
MVDFSPTGSPELDRLKRKLGVECLWIHILYLLNEKPMYAYAIQEELSKRFGLKVSRIISYRVLYPLETRGFVTSSEKEVNGRIRRYYSITKKGKELLKEGKTFIKRVASE